MESTRHDWIVFHRVRLRAPIDGTNNPLPGPKKAEAWRFYPASPQGPNGMRTNVSEEWGGFGIYPSRDLAEEVFENPDEHLPFLDDTLEAFHALVVPYSHRGKVDWRGSLMENETFKTCPSDPGGPLIVITSAGYENPGPDDLPRISNFIREVDRVQDFYATLTDNIRRAVFSGAGVDGHDGMTVSLWRTDAAMMAAAYKPGHHRAQMDYQREVGHFDHSSFSRARILASKGTWDGSNPVLEMS
ncbi:hypothetical protein [Yoonia sediminilitoris]|uniref:Spheroidene monooxygenase n=1 Tax=Yoonia sediminilitoris TaxID=1286148 RepID=A0A2T6KPJ9_9RHOB|nr:hypothetical protein [Yoonia sediminilitoris]PUB18477.1 hypothetical protein C8N45_10161 [Yoonia sediminilitoris]RCW98645.1 hypothetical protein DFP92_10161 [Yoonia sediminilitoris]